MNDFRGLKHEREDWSEASLGEIMTVSGQNGVVARLGIKNCDGLELKKSQ